MNHIQKHQEESIMKIWRDFFMSHSEREVFTMPKNYTPKAPAQGLKQAKTIPTAKPTKPVKK